MRTSVLVPIDGVVLKWLIALATRTGRSAEECVADELRRAYENRENDVQNTNQTR